MKIDCFQTIIDPELEKKIEIVLESDKKWLSLTYKKFSIVVSNVKLLILVVLTIALRILVNNTLLIIRIFELIKFDVHRYKVTKLVADVC